MDRQTQTQTHTHTFKPEAFLLRSFSIKQQRAIIDAVGRPRSRNRSNKRSKSEPTAAAATTTSATTTSATTRILKEMKLWNQERQGKLGLEQSLQKRVLGNWPLQHKDRRRNEMDRPGETHGTWPAANTLLLLLLLLLLLWNNINLNSLGQNRFIERLETGESENWLDSISTASD